MKRYTCLLLFVAVLSSCVTRKQLTYLQDKDETGQKSFELSREKYKVQPNDVLNITVKSFEESTSDMFRTSDQGYNLNNNAGELVFYINGFTIDPQGFIEIPVIGRVNVGNRNVDEIRLIVQKQLNDYFTEGTTYVNVQLAGVRFSVVGDVSKPGRYVIYQNQVNIFEALAEAGDITLVGNRKEVMILRQDEKGVTSIELDLTDAKVIENPYYFIQPNDVINVKPLPQRTLGIGTTGFQSFASIIGVLASTITLVLALNNLN